MKEKQSKSSSPKKAIEVPNTDTSQTEDKATRRFVVWMIAGIVLMVIVGAAVIYWLTGQYVQQSNKNKAQDLLIAALTTKQQNLKILQANYDKIIAKGANGISDADLILRALPTDKAYDILIAMLEKMTQDSGVKITSVSQENAATAEDTSAGGSTTPKPYTFSVTVEGTYTGVLEFMRKTEKAARVMNFSTMTISGNSNASSGGAIQATITMQTYYQGQANIESTFEELK